MAHSPETRYMDYCYVMARLGESALPDNMPSDIGRSSRNSSNISPLSFSRVVNNSSSTSSLHNNNINSTTKNKNNSNSTSNHSTKQKKQPLTYQQRTQAILLLHSRRLKANSLNSSHSSVLDCHYNRQPLTIDLDKTRWMSKRLVVHSLSSRLPIPAFPLVSPTYTSSTIRS